MFIKKVAPEIANSQGVCANVQWLVLGFHSGYHQILNRIGIPPYGNLLTRHLRAYFPIFEYELGNLMMRLIEFLTAVWNFSPNPVNSFS